MPSIKSSDVPPEKAPPQPISDKSPPPAYEENPNDIEFPPLPPLVDFQDAGPATKSTVTNTQCIAHLKLLSVFADLRVAISSEDRLFGIDDSQADQFVDENSKNQALARIREKRWAVYTTRAVDRYADWWHTCVATSGKAPCINDLTSVDYKLITQEPTPVKWSSKDLPPLDVLMVWHAHMLNPRAFLEDCIRGRKIGVWASGLPWELINQAIDDKTLNYNTGDEAKDQFQKKSGHPWDNLDEPPERAFSCLQCHAEVTAPWTRGKLGSNVETAFENGTGYADKNFEARCSNCNTKLDHQALRAARFHKDARAAVSNSSLPMPGTYLNLHGRPHDVGDFSFPNRMIQAGRYEIVMASEPTGLNRNMNTIRELVENAMKNTQVMLVANGLRGTRLRKEQRIAIRRMMSHYWDNSSIFSLDLVGAVIRQGTFVQKMDDLDWIHSPALQSTMTRLIKKYGVFFDIMAKNRLKMAVPTLDVDLAWHTHQLSPSRYYEYSVYQTGLQGIEIFIDHDDKVDEGKLSDAFKWTSKQYHSATRGEVYSECTCWYCEATREMSHSILSPSSRRARNRAEQLHDDPNVSSDPNNSPHISAHNAVRVQDAPSSYRKSTAMQEMRLRTLRAKWERREQNRRKRSDSTNNKNNDKNKNNNSADVYYYPMVWGYPYVMPFYAPYMCDPAINAGAYPCNPACMSVGEGTYGSCAAGSCGGGVAAGACGGGGSCAGGSGGGGCGGGGGGGGGCGGGGGGCGGGGGGGGGCGGGGGG